MNPWLVGLSFLAGIVFAVVWDAGGPPRVFSPWHQLRASVWDRVRDALACDRQLGELDDEMSAVRMIESRYGERFEYWDSLPNMREGWVSVEDGGEVVAMAVVQEFRAIFDPPIGVLDNSMNLVVWFAHSEGWEVPINVGLPPYARDLTGVNLGRLAWKTKEDPARSSRDR